MLMFYSFFLCYFLFLSYAISTDAGFCDDLDGKKVSNEVNRRSPNSTVCSQTTANSTRTLNATTQTQIVRSNGELTINSRSNGEARWFLTWFLVPYYGPYYEFYVNEYSYKFWAVFQMATVVILLYSAFAAIYFAKYTFLTQVDNIKEDDLLFWWRSFQKREFQGLDSSTYQRIMDAVSPS